MSDTSQTDAAWRELAATVDSDDELAPLAELRRVSRDLERSLAVLTLKHQQLSHERDCVVEALAAAEANDRRYKWLRMDPRGVDISFYDEESKDWKNVSLSHLDEAVDAALAAAPAYDGERG
jgi:hypothetical protein